jgi:membrane protease YdiL (CAAX protease family)
MPTLQALLVFVAVWIASHFLVPHSNSNHAQVQSVVLQLLLVLGFPLVASKLANLKLKEVFKFRSTSARNLLFTLVATVCLIFLLDEVSYLENRLVVQPSYLHNEIERLLQVNSLPQLIGLLLSMGIIPAICEECLFRGYVLDRLSLADSQWRSIMMSSVLFGLFHRSLYALLPITLSGIFLAFIAVRGGSLYNSIASHCMVNVWGIAVSNSNISHYLPWVGQSRPVPYALQGICLLGIFAAGRLLKKDD